MTLVALAFSATCAAQSIVIDSFDMQQFPGAAAGTGTDTDSQTGATTNIIGIDLTIAGEICPGSDDNVDTDGDGVPATSACWATTIRIPISMAHPMPAMPARVATISWIPTVMACQMLAMSVLKVTTASMKTTTASRTAAISTVYRP